MFENFETKKFEFFFFFCWASFASWGALQKFVLITRRLHVIPCVPRLLLGVILRALYGRIIPFNFGVHICGLDRYRPLQCLAPRWTTIKSCTRLNRHASPPSLANSLYRAHSHDISAGLLSACFVAMFCAAILVFWLMALSERHEDFWLCGKPPLSKVPGQNKY